jgi:Uma2 family endonuclease
MVDRARDATYADLLAAPEDRIAELVDGELFLSPRPSGPHALALRDLAYDLIGPFDRGHGGPGGWFIVVEPELHLARQERVLVPDIAGWRRERMPVYPQGQSVEVAPDWVAEVLSPSTSRFDRLRKMPLYAAHGVAFLWLLDPLQRTRAGRISPSRYARRRCARASAPV